MIEAWFLPGQFASLSRFLMLQTEGRNSFMSPLMKLGDFFFVSLFFTQTISGEGSRVERKKKAIGKLQLSAIRSIEGSTSLWNRNSVVSFCGQREVKLNEKRFN